MRTSPPVTSTPSGTVGPAAAIGIGAVHVYQWTLRPFIGPNCRFWPSCSDYAIDALRLHGAVKGTAMAARRVLRCNPWNAGGVDPVQPPGDEANRLSTGPAANPAVSQPGHPSTPHSTPDHRQPGHLQTENWQMGN